MTIPMPDPLAYFLTWTSYGTWLPGDDRGWVKQQKGIQLPDPALFRKAKDAMRELEFRLDFDQRKMVEGTIIDHCKIRKWELLAVNCLSNHVHVVVRASVHPDIVLSQLKAYCTRRLKEYASLEQKLRKNWWTENGSKQVIYDEVGLCNVIDYVKNRQ